MKYLIFFIISFSTLFAKAQPVEKLNYVLIRPADYLTNKTGPKHISDAEEARMFIVLEEAYVNKMEMRNDENTVTFPVFNLFLQLDPNQSRELTVASGLRYTGAVGLRYLATFSALPNSKTKKVSASILNQEEVNALHCLSFKQLQEMMADSILKEEAADSAKHRQEFSHIKNRNFRIIEENNGKYILYNTPTLTQFYVVAPYRTFYPIEGKPYMINPDAIQFDTLQYQKGLNPLIEKSDLSAQYRYMYMHSYKLYRSRTTFKNKFPISSFWAQDLNDFTFQDDMNSILFRGRQRFDYAEYAGIVQAEYDLRFFNPNYKNSVPINIAMRNLGFNAVKINGISTELFLKELKKYNPIIIQL